MSDNISTIIEFTLLILFFGLSVPITKQLLKRIKEKLCIKDNLKDNNDND